MHLLGLFASASFFLCSKCLPAHDTVSADLPDHHSFSEEVAPKSTSSTCDTSKQLHEAAFKISSFVMVWTAQSLRTSTQECYERSTLVAQTVSRMQEQKLDELEDKWQHTASKFCRATCIRASADEQHRCRGLNYFQEIVYILKGKRQHTSTQEMHSWSSGTVSGLVNPTWFINTGASKRKTSQQCHRPHNAKSYKYR